jgi:aryl-alcohol dehydrogenase-like predicted oxidoreductase/ectoine hydroxylase-related dioxygenase (phytanoyl-CoA dioxygenase family)
LEQRVLGRTGLRVSRVGLGSGGPSRLGRTHGGEHGRALAVVREAHARGVNFFDSSELYDTEALLAEALRELPRDQWIVSTKAEPTRDGALIDAAALEAKLDASLRRLGTDHVDLYLLHGLLPEHYDVACEMLVPALLRLRERGKLLHFGVSEAYGRDPHHRMLSRAALDPWWEVLFVGYNALDPTARRLVLPRAAELGTACVGMFAVSNRLHSPEAARETAAAARARGALRPDVLDAEDPLAPLCGGEGGAADRIEAAYRFALSEPGLHSVLIGTGDVEHLRSNLTACARGPLPAQRIAPFYEAFRPGTPDRARDEAPLEEEAREHYRSRGVLHRPGVLDEETLAALRAEAARLMHRGSLQRPENLRVEYRAGASGGTVLTKLDPATDLGERLDAIARDPRILGPVRALLGDEPVLLKDKLIYKPSDHPGFGCHQDHANWTPFSPEALSVFVALDPAPLEAGPVEVFPGLHQQGLTLAGGEFRASRDTDTPTEVEALPLPLEAGDLLLFHCLLPHRSGTNRSGRARRALLLTYSPAGSGDGFSAYYRHYAAGRGAGSEGPSTGYFDPPVRAFDEPGCPSVVTGNEPSRFLAGPPEPGTHLRDAPSPPVDAPRKRSPVRRLRRSWRNFRRSVRHTGRQLVARDSG